MAHCPAPVIAVAGAQAAYLAWWRRKEGKEGKGGGGGGQLRRRKEGPLIVRRGVFRIQSIVEYYMYILLHNGGEPMVPSGHGQGLWTSAYLL